ncbi:MAG: hypothetical protein ACKVX7_16990 [Planctomycetota bacterium]
MPDTAVTTTDFPRRVLTLATSRFDGVLTVEAASDPALIGAWWRFADGKIVDLAAPNLPHLLDEALLASPSIKDRDRKRLQKLAQQSGVVAGSLVLAQSLLTSEEISARVIAACELRFAMLLVADELHAPVTPNADVESPDSLAQYLQVSLSIEETLLKAAELAQAWPSIEAVLPCLKDVYYATPESFGYIQAADQFPLEVQLLGQLDGERDLREAIALAGGNPFEMYAATQRLLLEGSVALINPVQLFQFGNEYQRRGDSERALRRFQRAQDRGLDDFDLGFKLGEVYCALGAHAEAVEHFQNFAEKCATQFRIEDTIRAYRMIIEIEPANFPIQDRYLSLLTKYGKPDDTLQQGLSLARLLADGGQDARARATLDRILAQASGNEEVLRFYLELCARTGDEEAATRARRTLGELYHQREEGERALELYQNLFVQGDDSVETRRRLVELHYHAGNLETAREHLQALRGRDGWAPRRAKPEALEFFRCLQKSGLVETAVSAWLVEEARARGDREEIVRQLKQHRQNLETSGNLPDARQAAEQLFQIQPLDLDCARQLARLERAVGNQRAATFVLERVAHQLTRSGVAPDELRDLLQELVATDPHSLAGRRMLLALASAEAPAPASLHLEIGLLELIAGRDVEATRAWEAAQLSAQLQSYLLLISSRLAQSRGEQARAVSALHQCCKNAQAAQDRALLDEGIRALQQLTPSDPQLDEYRRSAAQLAQAPTPVAAASEPGPAVVKSSVSGITERLRHLKTGAPSTEPESKAKPVAPSTNTQAALSSVAKLRALKGGVAPVDSPSVPKTSAAPAAAQQPVGNTTEKDSAPNAGDFAPLPKPLNKPMGSAASKLSSLRKPG